MKDIILRGLLSIFEIELENNFFIKNNKIQGVLKNGDEFEIKIEKIN